MVRIKRNSSKVKTALQDLRQRKGLTQLELAQRTGVSRTALAEAESGARGLPIDAAMKAAPVLGTDPVTLYVGSTIRALKAAIRRGEELPLKAASVARALVELLEGGELSATQRSSVRAAVQELVELLEEHTASANPGTDFSERDEFSDTYAEGMASLDRDLRGRKKRLRRRRNDDVVDPNMDYQPESGEYRYVRKSGPQTTYEALGRDSFGRRRPR